MTTATYTNARNNFKHYCDLVVENREPVVITNQMSENVVLVSEEEWNAIVETAFIADDSNKMKRLLTSIGENERGEGIAFDDVSSMRESLLNAI